MILIFDTETTGLPRDWNAPMSDLDNWPRLVQLAWQLHEPSGKLVSRGNIIVKPDGFSIPFNAAKIHGITTERAERDGSDLLEVLDAFQEDLAKAKYIVGHNIEFDINIVGAELIRSERAPELLTDKNAIDSKDESTEYCAIPGGRGGKFKWPTLTELHTKLFGVGFDEAHDAAYDVDATSKCFFGLVTEKVIQLPEVPDATAVVYEAPVLEAANFEEDNDQTGTADVVDAELQQNLQELAEQDFVHLHVHSQFSILQAVSEVKKLVSTAKEMNMPAIALTDHGNMMAAFHFVRAALAADIKPIVGCEFNVCRNHEDKSQKDDGFQTVVLAKNKNGYHNLAKLASRAYTNGFYYLPRIDKELLEQYKEDLVVTTGGLWGEVPFLILNVGEAQAEEAFLWYKEQFGENFYAELTRHGLEEEDAVNAVLLQFCKKHDVKYIASNNTYYTKKQQAAAHDILLCVKDAENNSKPKKYIGKRGREFRFGFPNDEFYIKSPEEMKKLFADLPDAIKNTAEIAEQCEGYELARDVLLPAYDIPEQFVHEEDTADGGKRGENAFLRHLTYEGAKKRYGEVTEDISERLDFELATIERTGYPGYFLIVQDFTTKAREMGVSVGPGRGSAAGSAVAYCVGITNVDPIMYDLLFERFLNPDRVSMPDIDIDFDDEGRQRVIDYVIEKYGSNQVAQIITYGTMAAKSSIRDTARVMELPLPDADRLAKLIPDISLAKLFGLPPKELSAKLRNKEDVDKANTLKELSTGSDLEARTINTARELEGSVRNTGIHACGVIITPDDITNYVPIATAKDSSMACTQFDNSVAEDAGLLKMDFLGLKTLTLIKDAVKNVKERHNVDLDPDAFPLDDVPTYELFQRGETVGIFQYESAGMQKYLKELKPTVFADLIAMNALYRPGPLEYIPSFIKRKHGTEEIKYDLDAMKEYLEETYGITVYQEQVMLLSQKLAGFSKGEADTLRKAMGKKKLDLLAKMKPQFLDNGEERGHDREILEKVWKDWEAFASYAFNKSHSTCYAWIAYQTAYLKANYPEEYMASVLSNNMNDIKSVTFFMEECRRMGIPVLGPDVNESAYKFRVNDAGAIRFGLGAMRGVGEGAVNAIVEGREEGAYVSIYDFSRRVNLKDCNKRVFEGLALGGGFDSFEGVSRSRYFAVDEKGRMVIENAIRYGHAWQESENSSQVSLFGEASAIEIPEPIMPETEEWNILDQLNKEREVVGIYISGHPLDDFKVEMEHLCTRDGLKILLELDKYKGRNFAFGGMVSGVEHRTSKNGKPYGIFTIEDYNHAERFFLFGDDYVKFREYLVDGWFLFIKGSVKEKPFRRDNPELEFKISQVELLADIRERMKGELKLTVDLAALNDRLVTDLAAMVEKYPGNTPMTLEIRDLNAAITMPSKSARVELANDLLRELEQMDEIQFQVLTK
ncbi:MAG: DNA polymerase III subunit alpha [Flavobacteriales bacterium]|nr:DNA polymerase III subunit alpha [Flavobacteriales bacterium]MDG2247115.1 DNA polymerase III subunit alpha [Flavobacteriales bacterium]